MTQPIKKIKAGAITAALWENKGKGKEGNETTFHTVSLTRGYKDKEGNWQNTQSLRVEDLPKARLVLDKAYEELVLIEDEEPSSSSPSDTQEQRVSALLDKYTTGIITKEEYSKQLAEIYGW